MSDILYSKLRLEVPQGLDGESVTITSKSGNTRTVEMSSPITDIMLAGMEKYRVRAGATDEIITLGYGQIKKVGALYVPPNLDDASWSLIQHLILAGRFKEYYAVGDTKKFQIYSTTYTAEVVAINDGTESNAQWYPNKTVDFICKELYSTSYQYNSSRKNSHGFPKSAIKDTINNNIYPALPTDLKNVIIDKSHSYQSGMYVTSESTWGYSMTTLSTKLWLPTTYEINGFDEYYGPGEGSGTNKRYTLTSNIKSKVGGSATAWWLGSPYRLNGTDMAYVNSSGSVAGYYADSSQGVPICFRIG